MQKMLTFITGQTNRGGIIDQPLHICIQRSTLANTMLEGKTGEAEVDVGGRMKEVMFSRDATERLPTTYLWPD